MLHGNRGFARIGRAFYAFQTFNNKYNKLGPYFNPTYTRTGWIGQPPVLDRHEVVTGNGTWLHSDGTP